MEGEIEFIGLTDHVQKAVTKSGAKKEYDSYVFAACQAMTTASGGLMTAGALALRAPSASNSVLTCCAQKKVCTKIAEAPFDISSQFDNSVVYSTPLIGS
jgi:hypothetical protein